MYILANLQDQSSIDEAKSSGAGKLTKDILQNKKALAQSFIGGNTILVSVDRIVDSIKKAGLDPNNADDQEKILQYLENIVVHELGHNLGMCHDSDCVKGKKRHKDELMHESSGFAGEIYRGLSQNDIDRAASGLDKRAH